MSRSSLSLSVAALALALAACSGGKNDGATAQGNSADADISNKTIAASLDQNGKFYQAAKASGLDKTLAGPGPYTVLVADDAAFAKLPNADQMMQPGARDELTRILTYHIMPGAVLVADIDKAIDNGKGKTLLPTMNGATLTATKEGGKIVLTDGAGTKATLTGDDERFSNGVVHHIDSVLAPTQAAR